jgi:nucleotide-binding universal stress UspA family protein
MRTSVVVGVDGSAPAVRAAQAAADLAVRHGLPLQLVHVFSWPVLAGSVGVHVTTHARCPVLVVRGEAGAPEAPVIVGLDGSAPAVAAARAAFAEARARDCELVAALVRPSPRVWPAPAGGLPGDADRIDALQAGLDGVVDENPDVKVRREILHSPSPAHALATLAADLRAGLIVVGSRGIGGFRGLLMGGTCRALVDHAPCPLLVVPPAGTATATIGGWP